ncbi:hypothetical protein ACTOB_005158 [Actinoplanes oblitus]|uniref:Lipoprotein n=1 Tax=Actinoplanes oblitus TaxID=3040509 RepID=A0ABY8W6R8_9ACTN|nr:hypothetical protein [Actinoplanes oblitus]WIM93187.1 hypothetical protein ACTOB_005158 [Actinoplanes oblitus]
MLKRAGLFMSVAVGALALTAACSSSDSTAAGSTSGSSAAAGSGAATTAAATEAATGATTAPAQGTPVRTKATPTSDPGDGDMLAGLGADADWKKFIEKCDAPQKVMIQKVVTADVNGDGTFDALVAHACSPITSYWPTVVDVFDGASSSSKPKRLGTLLQDVGPDDMPYLDTLKVRKGVVTIEAYGVDKETDASCPSIYYTYEYKYTGAKFARISRGAGNANHCPDIKN